MRIKPGPHRTLTRRIARLLMDLLVEGGRGTLMLAPVIVPTDDDRDR